MAKRPNKKEVRGKYPTKSVNLKEAEVKPEEEESKERKPTNNPLFYAVVPQLLLDANNISWNVALGARKQISEARLSREYPVTQTTTHPYRTNRDNLNVRDPGLLVIQTAPSIGFGKEKYDPINTASEALFGFMRKSMSGRKNYEWPDLAIFLLSVSSMESFLTFCKRLWKLGYVSSSFNYYWAESCIRACGIDPDDLKVHLSDFRAWIDQFEISVRAYRVPANIMYFKLMMEHYGSVYHEADNPKEQLYMTVPRGFWRFNNIDTGSESPINKSGMLEFVPWYPDLANLTIHKVIDLERYGQQLMQHYSKNSSFSTMSGDIEKVFAGALYEGEVLGETPLELKTDPYMMSMIHNARSFDDEIWTLSADAPRNGENPINKYSITQDEKGNLHSWLVTKLSVDTSQPDAWQKGNSIDVEKFYTLMEDQVELTSDALVPGPLDTVEMTRFIPSYDPFEMDSSGHHYAVPGSWIVTGVWVCGSGVVSNAAGIVTEEDFGKFHRLNSELVLLSNVIGTTNAEKAHAIDGYQAAYAYSEWKGMLVGWLSTFHFAPRVYLNMLGVDGGGSSTADDVKFYSESRGRMWRTATMALVDHEDIRKMNVNAMISLWMVPGTDGLNRGSSVTVPISNELKS